MNALKTSQAALYPTADISINKQRVKKYGKDVFLKNGSNFEIELSNNTTSLWLAKFKINGKYISTSGLVLKPGQHHYLERYLDNPKKLLFSTYEVGNTEAVKKAIANNGLVEVEFYEEAVPVVSAGLPYQYTYTGQDFWYNNPGSTSRKMLYDSYDSNSTSKGADSSVFCSSFVSDNSMREQPRSVASTGKAYSRSMSKSLSSPVAGKIETGRIEEGANSNQRFGVSNDEFNSWVAHTVTFHLKPESQMNIRPEDIKVYCTNCGTSLKAKWNNCPSCGKKK